MNTYLIRFESYGLTYAWQPEVVGDAAREFVGIVRDDDEGDGGVGAVVFNDTGGE